LPEDVKNERRDRLMAAQQEVAFAWSAAQLGREIPVIVDSPDPDFPSHMLARGPADAPEIDCQLRVKGKNLRPGDFVKAKITAADGYDLAARAIGPSW